MSSEIFKKTVLENGLRIVTIPQENSKALTVLVLAATGSKYEKKEINGISHFLEHLLFKGTEKRPNPIAISEPLDRVGGVYNAFTSEEYTGYFAKVDSSHLDLALDVISDIYLNSKLDPKEIDKERGVIIEEINMRFDHPMSYVESLWNKLLYGEQPAGWDIAGTKETVSKIGRDSLSQYMESQYVSRNTLVCVAGGIKDKEKETIEKIKKYFSSIKNKEPLKKSGVIEKQENPEVLLYKKETEQTHLCLGVRGYHLFDENKYIQDVLAAILGGMMSSRLFVRIREELGLAYYISCAASSCTDTGYLVAQAGVDNGKAEKAISAILEEYKKITKEKVSKEELDKAKENIKGKMALALETSDAQASFHGLQEILENEILTPKDIYDKIDKVSVNDVSAVAKDIFSPRKLNLALIGPFDDKKRFQNLLSL